MSRSSSQRRIANALSKLAQGRRLVSEGERELRAALRAMRDEERRKVSVVRLPSAVEVCEDGDAADV